eukprot:GSMAST32.ASY1.ANO1.3.1 assembled CDS
MDRSWRDAAGNQSTSNESGGRSRGNKRPAGRGTNGGRGRGRSRNGDRSSRSRNDARKSPNNSNPRSQRGRNGQNSQQQTKGNDTSVNNQQKDRFFYSTVSLVGSVVGISLKDGTIIEGVFASLKIDEENEQEHKILLKCAQVKNTTEGSLFAKSSAHKQNAFFHSTEYVSLWAMEVESLFENPTRRTGMPGFITDSDISSGRNKGKNISNLVGRKLQGVGSEWISGDMPDNFKEETHATGSWDQFEANKRLFNVESNFDESLYTTALPGAGEQTDEMKKRASRIASEIEGTESSNFHIQEERNQKDVSNANLDPEDRYSGVLGNRNAETQSEKTPSNEKVTENAWEGFTAARNQKQTKTHENTTHSPTNKVESSNKINEVVKTENTYDAKDDQAKAATPDKAEAPKKSKLKSKLKITSKLNAKSSVFVPGGAKAAAAQASMTRVAAQTMMPGMMHVCIYH